MILNKDIRIIEEFLRDFNDGITGSFIAQKNKLNQKTVSNYLKRLEKENIVKSKTEGRNRLYRLNMDNAGVTKNFIIAIEHLRTINFYKRNLLIKDIAEQIYPLINGIGIIFGSYAKKTEKEDSDLDVLIIGKCNKNGIEKISGIYNIEISLKVYPKLQKDILTTEAIKNHIIIKNAEQFIGELANG